MNEYQANEVKWYRQHGRFANTRIRRDGHGEEYVIGDLAWNRGKPRHAPEWIENEMTAAIEAKASDGARSDGQASREGAK